MLKVPEGGRVGDNPLRMPNPDRLSGLDASFLAFERQGAHMHVGFDASFLAFERQGAHMHVGSLLVFEGPSPAYDELLAHVETRLHLVPRYRQRLAFPPL